MARLKVNRVLEFGLVEKHVSTDWMVYSASGEGSEDDEPVVIFESLDDEENLLEITATLRNSDGTFYDPYAGSTAMCRLGYGTFKTAWFNLPPCQVEYLPGDLPYKLEISDDINN